MSAFPSLAGKKVFVVSHDLSQSGAPMLLIETVKKMTSSGAHVLLTSLSEDLFCSPLFDHKEFELVGFEYSFFEASKADLVIVNTAVCKEWVSIFLDRYEKAGSKLIWWIHELSPDQSYLEQGRFGEGMDYLDRVKRVVFDSQASQELWKESGLALFANVMVVHPCVTNDFIITASKNKVMFPPRNWVDRIRGRSLLNRRQIRRRLGVGDNDFLITLVGRYSPEKGQDLLAASINQVITENPEMRLKLLLVGFWNREARERFLTIYGSSAISRPRMSLNTDELHCFYRAGDCFIMNSQYLGECFGRVTIEAMTHQLPVLGTDAGGTREIIENGVTGLLHPVGEAGQQILKENIVTLYKNRSLAKKMGEAGFVRVNQLFREERLLAEFNDAIR